MAGGKRAGAGRPKRPELERGEDFIIPPEKMVQPPPKVHTTIRRFRFKSLKDARAVHAFIAARAGRFLLYRCLELGDVLVVRERSQWLCESFPGLELLGLYDKRCTIHDIADELVA